MNGPLRNAFRVPRSWLWLARVITLLFALVSVVLVLAILTDFLRSGSSAAANLVGLLILLAALVSGCLPYALVIWNLKSEKQYTEGAIQLVIIGAFWFFLNPFILTDRSFQAWGIDSSELFQVVLGIGLFVTVPSVLLSISGQKILHSRSSPEAADTFEWEPSLAALRIGVRIALILLVLPPLLSLFSRPHPSTLQFVIVEALLVAGILPYGFVLRGLGCPERRHQAWRMSLGIAVGYFSLLVLAGATYGLILAETPTSRPHYKSTWAEVAFFALLCLANFMILVTSFRLERSLGGMSRKKLLITILAVPFCLFMYAIVVVLYSAAT